MHQVESTGGARRRPRPGWLGRRLDPHASFGLRLTLASIAALLVLVPFAVLLLLVQVTWRPLRRLDTAITDALHGLALDHPAWVRVMTIWTDVFAPMPLRAVVAVLVVWLLRRGARRLAWWAAATMATGGLLGVVVKLLVGRHRPDLLDPVSRAPGYSFPSGHALTAALAAGVLLLVFLPLGQRGWPRWALWAGAATLALLTGFSRIALGVHWASDVLAGWVLAAAVLAATSAAFATWRAQAGRPPAAVLRDGVEPEAAAALHSPGHPDEWPTPAGPPGDGSGVAGAGAGAGRPAAPGGRRE